MSALTPPLTEDDLLPLLQTRSLGRRVLAYAACGSTNEIAGRLVEQGADGEAPHGLLVLTDHQTAGRGRAGHKWIERPGSSLLFSLILDDPPPRPPRDEATPPPPPPALPMAAPLALLRALEDFGIPDCGIKWPNDLLDADGRKVSGMLIERRRRPGGMPVLVLGLGLNVCQQPGDFAELPPPGAASLAMLTDAPPPPRAALLARILLELERLLESADAASVLQGWMRHCVTLGRLVAMRSADGTEIEGRAVGLEPDGRLVLREASGRLLALHSGDIRELRRREEGKP